MGQVKKSSILFNKSNMTNNAWLSRKFVLILVAVISLTVMGIMNKIDAGQYISTLPILLGSYLGANVAQKIFTPAPKV